MKKKLTKRTTLELCLVLWVWLSKHPSKEKDDWPGWENLWEMRSFCPCCEYAGGQSSSQCRRCFLLKLWIGKKKLSKGDNIMCLECCSPYYQYNYNKSNKTKKKYALIIVEGIKTELSKLPKLKGRNRR